MSEYCLGRTNSSWGVLWCGMDLCVLGDFKDPRLNNEVDREDVKVVFGIVLIDSVIQLYLYGIEKRIRVPGLHVTFTGLGR